MKLEVLQRLINFYSNYLKMAKARSNDLHFKNVDQSGFRIPTLINREWLGFFCVCEINFYALMKLDTVNDVIFVNGELPEYMRDFINQKMAKEAASSENSSSDEGQPRGEIV